MFLDEFTKLIAYENLLGYSTHDINRTIAGKWEDSANWKADTPTFVLLPWRRGLVRSTSAVGGGKWLWVQAPPWSLACRAEALD